MTTEVVVIRGEAGIGKSRLLAAFLEAAGVRGVRVLLGGCISTAASTTAYGPLADALGRLIRDEPALAALWMSAVRGGLAQLLPAAGLAAEGPAEGLDRALLEAIGALAGPPLVLAIEDVQWCDASTRAILERLVSRRDTQGLLLVLTLRTDEPAVPAEVSGWVHRLGSGPAASSLDLLPLDAGSVEGLATQVLGAAPSPAVLERLRRGGGNPLFVEQLLREPGDALPNTVRQLAVDRLASLPGRTQRVLRAAAVLAASEADIDEDDVSALTGLAGDTVADALRSGSAAGLLLVGGSGVRFRHMLLRDAVDGELLPAERRRLHTLAADRLEARHAGVSTAARIAYHRVLGGDAARAVTALRRAGVAQRAILALPEASLHYGRAVEIMDRELVRIDDLADFLEEAAQAMYLGTHAAAATEIARRAIAALRPDDDHGRRSRLHLLAAEALWANAGDATGALAELDRALAESPRAPAAVLAGHARFQMLLNQWRAAEAEADDAVAAGRADHDWAAVASALVTRGISLAHLGFVDRGLRLMRTGRWIGLRQGDVVSVGRSYVNRVQAMRLGGRLEHSVKEGLEGIKRSRDLGIELTIGPAVAQGVVHSLCELGRFTEAQHVLAEVRTSGAANLDFRVTEARGRLALARGDVAGALAMSEELLAFVSKEPQVLEPILTIRAEALLESGRTKEALASAEAAIHELALAGSVDSASRALWLATRANHRASSDVSAVLGQLAGRPMLAKDAAYTALAWAEAAGPASPDAWRSAAAACMTSGALPLVLYAELCLAAAEFSAGNRAAGRATLFSVHANALAGGFGCIQRGATRLARRARIVLEPATSGERPAGLTAREVDVLGLLATGHSNRQIAAELFISENTVEIHVSRVLSKLGLARRSEAAAYAHRHGLSGSSVS